ncbi:MAG: DUF2281 domain-containing protein [Rubrivivax sp.]|nr:DUF2281 domain-containing protein [Rubrivivax sp.]
MILPTPKQRFIGAALLFSDRAPINLQDARRMMMTLAEAIYRRSQKLPEEAAREVLDFIDFLGQRYGVGDVATNSAAYDEWFKAQVRRALDDPRPGVPNAQVREHFAQRRNTLREQAENVECN